jgi:hypothetical protein
MEEIIKNAKRVSKERGYPMYIIYDNFDDDYGFTQEKNIFLFDNQSIVGEVDGDEVIIY